MRVDINWVDSLPRIFRDDLQNNHGNIVGIDNIQQMVNQSLSLKTLLSQDYRLFWLLISYATQHKWDEIQIVKVSQLAPLEIIKSCGLPNKIETQACLQKIDTSNYLIVSKPWAFPALFELIYSLLKLDVSELIKKNNIDICLVEILYNHPELIGARFIRQNDVEGDLENIMTIRFNVNEVKRLAKIINYPKTHRLLMRCRHEKDLKQAMNRLQIQVSNVIVDELNKLDYLTTFPEATLEPYLKDIKWMQARENWSESYPVSPIPLIGDIKCLTNFKDIFIEAHTQHNCLVDYHDRLDSGIWFVYKVLAPQRATLALYFKEDSKILHIDDLCLKENRNVSNKTKQFVLKWLRDGNYQLLKQQTRNKLVKVGLSD